MKGKTWILLALWGLLTLGAWFGPAREVSDGERRKLAQMPALTWGNLLSGRFSRDFESYTLDQFPLRDRFRQIKALTHYYALGQGDKEGVYLENGHAAQQLYPMNEASVDHAMTRFRQVYEKFLTGSRVYFGVIPDKNRYLAEVAGQPSLDYETLLARVEEQADWATVLDLGERLTLDSYYRTDTHWKQETLLPVAEQLAAAMGNPLPEEADYTPVTLERPFYGVYYGQTALPLAPDTITLLTNDTLENATVWDFESGTRGKIYDLEKLDSRDLYDVYLSGARALLTIENPAGTPGKELLIFRDSYASALTPLLLGDYSRVTLVDLRYISPRLLESHLTTPTQDALFLCSTLILNDSSAIK